MQLDEEIRQLEHALAASHHDQSVRGKLHTLRGAQEWGQCDVCGGSLFVFGPPCSTCGGSGALPPGHEKLRKCYREKCGRVLHPSHVAVYCTNACAWEDA